MSITNNRKPDFNNILKILKRQVPDRPTLFEFFLNDRLYKRLAADDKLNGNNEEDGYRTVLRAFYKGGYDYCTMMGAEFKFPSNHQEHKSSISQNEGGLIFDRESFEAYQWPDPNAADYSRLEVLGKELPEGMKFITWSYGGVLENVTTLLGYENMCFMTCEDPDLLQEIFDAVGSRLLKYTKNCSEYDSVGAQIVNDDWGFNSQTMLKPDDMRKYVIPWHKKIVEVIHSKGRPAIMHSCGQLTSVMDDIIDDVKFDAKHSYQDTILPVEEAYEKWGSRIAILGGIDLDFICRATPEEITKRCVAMLERTSTRGGYGLGTGNSVPYYVPDENYFAMVKAAIPDFKI